MKLRSSLLALALLLPVTLASASSTGAADTPDVTTEGEVAIMTPVEASPDCSTTELPIFAPAPSERAAISCGNCSDSACQNRNLKDFCGFRGGRTYTCESIIYEQCSDSQLRCDCWTGPIP
ncbi:MAG TPA: hypothetical protein VHQ65_13310 [Thermoanaerobaculia bacterium]|nr:hypothetical protein [Thermoanaerobaculia bacterium]